MKKKITLIGILLLLLGSFQAFGAYPAWYSGFSLKAQIPTILPFGPITEDAIFKKDVYIEGTLYASLSAGIFSSLEVNGTITLENDETITNATNGELKLTSPKIYADGDIFTDRWLEQDTNTFFGVGVVGTGNLVVGGIYNSFFGQMAGYSNTTGHSNCFFGRTTGFSNTSGYYNSFFGRDAGRFQNDGTSTLQTPESSTYLGASTKSGSDPAGGEDAIDNEIVIGYDATGNGSNTVTLGNDSITNTYLKGEVYAPGFRSTAYYDNGNSGAAKTIDWNNGNIQHITLTAVGVNITFTEPPHPGKCELWVIQDATGSRTIDWEHEVSPKWPGDVEPTLSTAANAVDVVCFTYIGGTTYRGLFNGDFR